MAAWYMARSVARTAKDVIAEVRHIKHAAMDQGETPTQVEFTPEDRAAFELATADELRGYADVSDINRRGLKDAMPTLLRLKVVRWDAPVTRVW